MFLFLSCWLSVLTACSFESPQLCSAQANRYCVSECYRKYCVKQLLFRHVRPGMSVSQFARLLDNPVWLEDRDVRDGFWTPVMPGSISMFCRCVNGGTVLYFYGITGPDDEGHILLSARIGRDRFVRALRGGQLTPEEEVTLVEVSFKPPL
jgi:hypothetical protein